MFPVSALNAVMFAIEAEPELTVAAGAVTEVAVGVTFHCPAVGVPVTKVS